MSEDYTPTTSTVTGQLAAMERLGHQGSNASTQIKTASTETGVQATSLPAISDTSSACMKNNECPPKGLTHLTKEESRSERVKAIIDSSKLNIYSHPDMPRNVRFDLGDDDTEYVQPVNNQSLQYYCELCNTRTNTYRNHLKHHLLLHSIKAAKKQIVHFWLVPDVSDPNHKYRSCERSYSNAADYRRHLRFIHRTPIQDATGGRPKKTPTANNNQPLPPAFGPDLDEINLYCRPCNRLYQTMGKYRLHKSSKHNQPSVKNPKVLPEWDNPTGYCRSCDHTFSSREAFHRHCKVDHKMNANGLLSNQQTQLPNPLDPNYHCSVCDLAFKDRKTYRRHCRYQHAMDLAPARLGPNANTNLLPDLTDQHHYCRTCDKTFPSKMRYWRHIRLIHNLKPKALCKSALPDINDPNNYCSMT